MVASLAAASGGDADQGRSQSPSLRGSGRFAALAAWRAREAEGLNPLHCGAVVASDGVPPAHRRSHRVSIPFIAGQWSLRQTEASGIGDAAFVSIPFIAGQWSLQARARRAAEARAAFQSPSLRGSGRFPSPHGGGGQVSIPFIAGQWSLPAPEILMNIIAMMSQSPSLRGSGRFRVRHRAHERRNHVSIPFIAGQWSLPPRRVDEKTLVSASQSPSLRGSGRFAWEGTIWTTRYLCLNPLHCGAVVASCWRRRRSARSARGLNPLHCGAVVASRAAARARQEATGLNPLHCGAVVASRRLGPRFGRRSKVSIPFIAGQWSLRRRSSLPPPSGGGFQSPSLRGSGRFQPRLPQAGGVSESFNPLHCGAVVASERRGRSAERGGGVSIPFIAGQWSLPGRRPPATSMRSCFNPLHCGAVVASRRDRDRDLHHRRSFNPLHCGAVVASPAAWRRGREEDHVSIPFIAGQWSLLRVYLPFITNGQKFQSPSLRGSGRFSAPRRERRRKWRRFNPLHCGAVVASGGDALKSP